MLEQVSKLSTALHGQEFQSRVAATSPSPTISVQGDVYLSLDVELMCGSWIHAAYVIATYPQGKVLATDEAFALPVRESTEDDCDFDFWTENSEALQHIKHAARATTRSEAELRFVKSLIAAAGRHRRIWLVSDNPAIDFGVLNGMMSNQIAMGHIPRQTSMNVLAADGRYRQVLCSWSYALAVRQALGISSRHLRTTTRRLRPELNNVAHDCPAHTALKDAACGLVKLFRARDVITSTKQRRISRKQLQ